MFFPSLHSSKRKFAPAQYVNRERFLFPYLHSLFVICSSLCRCSSPFGGGFLRLFSICPCGSHRLLFVFCSSFVRSFIICSCGSHRLFITCPSCYDSLSCYDCSYDSHCGINSAFANYPIIYYLCPIVND